MKTRIFKLKWLVIALSLISGVGFANENKKLPPAKTQAIVPKQEKAQVASVTPATNEEINWQVISSGGTKGTSASYILDGTVGQTAVGYGSSASYNLSHGYWQEFGPTSCCNHDGVRGDVNYDLGGPNVADLTYLVDFLFRGGPPPPCVEEADVNGDAAGPNVADLTYLVDFLFRGGPPPPACP